MMRKNWRYAISGILYLALLPELFSALEKFAAHDYGWTFWIILSSGMLILYFMERSVALAFDLFVTIYLLLAFFGIKNTIFFPFLFFPLVTAVLISTFRRIESRLAILFAWSFSIIWFLWANQLPIDNFSTSHYLFLLSGIAMLAVFTSIRLLTNDSPLKEIDVLLCSFSGNTAHFVHTFLVGAAQAGASINIHRFHYHKSFNAQFTGDSLVIGFPVFGFKPPWPFFYYLLFKLPRGKGKRAFILYSCVGGAENAGILCWSILTLKGYRVIGRNWGIYPLSAPTFRLGARKIWRFFDSIVPFKSDTNSQRQYGRHFALGKPSGIPFVFGLTPLMIFGILIDNKFIDTFLYRNHVIKKKCTHCNICLRYCPAERLIENKKGAIKPKGPCTICMGCVNICPHNAMHIWFFTEYGCQYSPRFRKLMVKGKLPRD